MILCSHCPADTESIGARLAQYLQPGQVIAFTGDLGAGKTAFTRGIARGLGIQEPITSPTYTIVNEYDSGRIPLFHFDMYRLHSEEDLFDIGWDDYMDRCGICVVEWSENVPQVRDEAIRIEIRKAENAEDDRTIIIEGLRKNADFGV